MSSIIIIKKNNYTRLVSQQGVHHERVAGWVLGLGQDVVRDTEGRHHARPDQPDGARLGSEGVEDLQSRLSRSRKKSFIDRNKASWDPRTQGTSCPRRSG